MRKVVPTAYNMNNEMEEEQDVTITLNDKLLGKNYLIPGAISRFAFEDNESARFNTIEPSERSVSQKLSSVNTEQNNPYELNTNYDTSRIGQLRKTNHQSMVGNNRTQSKLISEKASSDAG